MSFKKGFLLVAAIVVAMAATLLALSMGWLPGSSSRHPSGVAAAEDNSNAADDASRTSPHTGASNDSCLPRFLTPDATLSLQRMLARARHQVEQQQSNDALEELRNIAAVDPALPGLNLNLSMAYMQLHRTNEAKSAIDAQLSVSDCLTKLPPASFAAYCRAELSLHSLDDCRQQVGDVQRTAHMQAAMVEMELGRSPQPVSSGVLAQAPEAEPRPASALAAQAKPLTASKPRKHPVDDSLAQGAGTDAALGAYSK